MSLNKDRYEEIRKFYGVYCVMHLFALRGCLVQIKERKGNGIKQRGGMVTIIVTFIRCLDQQWKCITCKGMKRILLLLLF